MQRVVRLVNMTRDGKSAEAHAEPANGVKNPAPYEASCDKSLIGFQAILA